MYKEHRKVNRFTDKMNIENSGEQIDWLCVHEKKSVKNKFTDYLYMKKTVINIVTDYMDMDQTVMNRFTDNVYVYPER
jgi:hypothetical protein